MQINNAWYSKTLPTQIIIETTDGVKHLVDLAPYREVAVEELRNYYGVEKLDSTDEIQPYCLACFGFDKVTLPCSDRLKAIRKRAGLSQAAFSVALGIPLRTVESWEMGVRECQKYVVDLIEYRVANDKTIRTNKT